MNRALGLRWALSLATAVSLTATARAQRYGSGELKISVVDRETGQPLPCRIHLKNTAGVFRKPNGVPYWADHFTCTGSATLSLSRGAYVFEIECGPEFPVRYGRFNIDNYAVDDETVDMPRKIDMAADGWLAGDLHVHRPVKDIELLMKAENLHVVPLLPTIGPKSARPAPGATIRQDAKELTSFDGHFFYNPLAAEIATEQGSVRLLNLPEPLEVNAATSDPLSTLELIRAARAAGAWVDVDNPAAADLPLWLAEGLVDSIGVASSQLPRSGAKEPPELGVRPRNKDRYPGIAGLTRWNQELYYRVLDAGLRIPPSAGSGSGESANPLGYNRVYVFVGGKQPTYEAWWDHFRLGEAFITNGPLMAPQANGEWPGFVFQAPDGERLEIEATFQKFSTRELPKYLELVQDGEVAHTLPFDEFAKTGRFPALVFERSGWFLVRVVTADKETTHFAMSAPWHVEIGEPTRRVSREAAQFFLDWLNERAAAVKVTDPERRAAIDAAYAYARTYWQDVLQSATAD